MVSVLEALMTTAPREVSGAWTSAFYDLQKNVSLLLLIELHQSGNEFRMLFDHHDDILVLNHPDNPTCFATYQVKVKDDPWLVSDVAKKRSKTVPKSIISKMYDHVHQFQAAVSSITLATNAGFSFELADGSTSGIAHSTLTASQLSAAEQAKLNSAVSRDFPAPWQPYLERTKFLRFGLPVVNQDQQVKGRLIELFEALGGGEGVPIKALYDHLFAEVARKSRPTTATTVEGFCKEKSIDSGQIGQLFGEAMTGKRLDVHWQGIQAELAAAGMDVQGLIRMRKLCFNYVCARAAGKPQAVRFAALLTNVLSTAPAILQGHPNLIAAAAALEAAIPAGAKCPYSGLPRRAGAIVHALEALYDEGDEFDGAEEAPEQLEGAW